MTGETLPLKLVEQDPLRAISLQHYSVTRTYLVKNDKGELRAEAQVQLQHQAPSSKVFQIIFEKGPQRLQNIVKSLLKMEVETASGGTTRDSSIAPANFTFEVLGEEQVDGYHCFIVQATPKRREKYLFEGKIWMDDRKFAIVKIAGHPAKNPSFWIKKADFMRRYQKVGNCWLPWKDETIAQVRVLGKNTLTIDHKDYKVSIQQAGVLSEIRSARQPLPEIARRRWFQESPELLMLSGIISQPQSGSTD
jgi:hypothetical protein